MFVSVDRENLVFLHKHTRQDVVSGLVDIEAPHVATSVIPCEQPADFRGFTDYELLKLYKHSTGTNNPVGYYRPGLENLCLKAAQSLPCNDATAWEVDRQRHAIAENDPGRYRYVKGSLSPAPVEDLFETVPLRATVAAGEVAAATVAQATPGIAATGPDRQRTPTPRAAAPIGAVPRGGQREIIWSCADKFWEAAGKPVALPVILTMRKQIMDTLEQQGVKRTSASSELGNWQKARVAAK